MNRKNFNNDAKADNKGYNSTIDNSNDRFVDSEEKFRRYLTSSLFGNGIHAWWLICLFAVVTMIAVVFSFVAAYIDLKVSLHSALMNQNSPKIDNQMRTLYDSERTLTEI